jgi:hypothetical protein
MSHRRMACASAWLEAREPAEEVLIVGASLDAANEVARGVARMKGAAFGWHRLSLTQLAAALAAPTLAARSTVPVSRLGTQAMAARVVHALAADGALGRYAARRKPKSRTKSVYTGGRHVAYCKIRKTV